jgi:hypothetical protein
MMQDIKLAISVLLSFLALIGFTSCCNMRNQNSDIPTDDYFIKVIALQNMHYGIDIYRKSDSTKTQTIDLRNGEDPAKENNAKIININNVPHLYILGGRTEKGNWYKVWKWNSSISQFVWDKTSEPGEVK